MNKRVLAQLILPAMYNQVPDIEPTMNDALALVGEIEDALRHQRYGRGREALGRAVWAAVKRWERYQAWRLQMRAETRRQRFGR